ncbi:MAG: hypothetical protein QNK92_04900, partial [Amylibacter sp.]
LAIEVYIIENEIKISRIASFNSSPHLISIEPTNKTSFCQSFILIATEIIGITTPDTNVNMNSLAVWPKAIPRAAAARPNLFKCILIFSYAL